MQSQSQYSLRGLNCIRFFSIILMNHMHATVSLALVAGLDFSERNLDAFTRSFNTLYLLSIFIWILPAIAGLFFYERLRPDMSFGRLTRSKTNLGVKVFLFFTLLESCKDLIFFGKSYVFSWSALHLAGLSFLLITILARLGSAWFIGLAMALLVATPYLRTMLGPYFALSHTEQFATYHSSTVTVSLACLCLLAFVFLALHTTKSKSIRPEIKGGCFALLAALFSATLLFILGWNPNDMNLSLTLRNLPLTWLIGDPDHNSYNTWPLLPWLATSMIAFAFYDFYERSKRKNLFRAVLLSAAVLVLSVFFRTAGSDLGTIYDNRTVWSSIAFQPANSVIAATLGMFFVVVFFWDFVEPRLPVKLRNIIANYSLAILWIYLFQTSLGFWLAKPFVKLFGFGWSAYFYPLFVLALSYPVGLFCNQLSRTRIHIRLKSNGSMDRL